MTKTVTSKDGTTIAYERSGVGPALIVVGGALSYRSHPTVTELVERLSQHFTVFSYNRRGRFDSGDADDYAVEREIEDIAALLDIAGGTAYVYAVSSGAALALEAAARMPHKVTKAVLYEPPYIIDDTHPPVDLDYIDRLNAAIAANDPERAVKLFMTIPLRIPEDYLVGMQHHPGWPDMVAVAHTLVYDATIMGDTMRGNPLPAGRWQAATQPILVISGEQSEQFLQNTARALADALPDAAHYNLTGQGHDVAASAIVPVLVEYFGG